MILTGKRNVADEGETPEIKSLQEGGALGKPPSRSGTDARRIDRKHQFYPIFLNAQDGSLHSVGEALLPTTAQRTTVRRPMGLSQCGRFERWVRRSVAGGQASG